MSKSVAQTHPVLPASPAGSGHRTPNAEQPATRGGQNLSASYDADLEARILRIRMAASRVPDPERDRERTRLHERVAQGLRRADRALDEAQWAIDLGGFDEAVEHLRELQASATDLLDVVEQLG